MNRRDRLRNLQFAQAAAAIRRDQSRSDGQSAGIYSRLTLLEGRDASSGKLLGRSSLGAAEYRAIGFGSFPRGEILPTAVQDGGGGWADW